MFFFAIYLEFLTEVCFYICSSDLQRYCCARTNWCGGGPALQKSNLEKWTVLTTFSCSEDLCKCSERIAEVIRTRKYSQKCSFLEIILFQSGPPRTNLYEHNSILILYIINVSSLHFQIDRRFLVVWELVEISDPFSIKIYLKIIRNWKSPKIVDRRSSSEISDLSMISGPKLPTGQNFWMKTLDRRF